MEFFVWDSLPIGNACVLDGPENFEKPYQLRTGASFAAAFPADVLFRMAKRHGKDTGLTDDLVNGAFLKVCSAEVVAFLQKRKAKNLEYLPVSVLDHKGKPTPRAYFIVSPLGLQAALDLEKSKPRYNRILKTQISQVERLVLDTAKIEPGVRIFRLTGLSTPVFVEKDLAQEMQAAGFTGSSFLKLDEYND